MSGQPDPLDNFLAFLAFLGEASREGRAREASYREWLGEALPAMADHLSRTVLPPEFRAAGMRFEWAEQW